MGANRDLSTLPKRLTYALEKSGLSTQARLAEVCGINKDTINSWMTGKTDPEDIHESSLRAVANCLGPEVTTEWLRRGGRTPRIPRYGARSKGRRRESPLIADAWRRNVEEYRVLKAAGMKPDLGDAVRWAVRVATATMLVPEGMPAAQPEPSADLDYLRGWLEGYVGASPLVARDDLRSPTRPEEP